MPLNLRHTTVYLLASSLLGTVLIREWCLHDYVVVAKITLEPLKVEVVSLKRSAGTFNTEELRLTEEFTVITPNQMSPELQRRRQEILTHFEFIS